MQNVLSSLKNFVKDATDYNSATLSGAVDVVAVQHEDGTFHSTPFHVRFGKFMVLRSRQKPVKIFVNDVKVPLKMKLGSKGAAYFVHETDAPVENIDYITSPLGSPLSSPEISPEASPLSSPRSESDDFHSFSLQSGDNNDNEHVNNATADPNKSCNSNSTVSTPRSLSDDEPESVGNSAIDRDSQYCRKTAQFLIDEGTAAGENDKKVSALSNGSRADAQNKREHQSDVNIAHSVETGAGLQFKPLAPSRDGARERSMSSSRPWSSFDARLAASADFAYPTNVQPVCMTVRRTFEQAIAISSAFQIVVWEFKTQAYNIDFSVEFHVTDESSGTLQTRTIRPLQRVDSHLQVQKGLFVSAGAGLLLLKWDNTFSKLRNKHLQYMVHHVGSGAAHGPTGASAEIRDGVNNAKLGDISSSDAPRATVDEGTVPPSIQFFVDTVFGLGRLAVPCTETSPTVGIQLFNNSSWGMSGQQPVVCYCDRSRVRASVSEWQKGKSNHCTYTWDSEHNTWLPFDPVRQASLGLHESPMRASLEINEVTSNDVVQPRSPLDLPLINAATPNQKQDSKQRHFKKSVHPTSDQIALLGLKPGANTLAFEVYSRLQGRSRIECTIFLWSPTAKVVISDVDGTITKSDVMGHVMFMIGRDWTHNGVAPLFDKIASQGYQFVYLTSRNIGQVDNTKSYLRNIRQDQCKLPQGAVITSPDGLFAALNREMVQRRPQEFKITALRDLRHCFPATHNPFYAGFGNRATDVVSYRAVGVPEGRIYIVNPAGEIRHFNHMYRASYTSLQQLVDVMFPAFSDGSFGDRNAGARKFQESSYSSYNYWKTKPFEFLDVDTM